MGIYDRDYKKDSYEHSDSYERREYFRSGGPFSHLPTATRWIMIANIIVFLLTIIPVMETWFFKLFSVFPENYVSMVQIWRFVTYQFLHGDPVHIFFNMLMLYYLGPEVEGLWGTRTYLRFYLISGAVGGIMYTFLVAIGALPAGYLIGASGAIYGLIAAYACLFPNKTIYFFMIIPVRLMTLLLICIVFSFYFFMRGSNPGGEAAHLTGIAVGIFYVTARPRMVHWRMARSKGAWERKLQQERQFENEVDRVLAKVHENGVGSLTRQEKEILKEATRREQKESKLR